jgi:hypothetical protein
MLTPGRLTEEMVKAGVVRAAVWLQEYVNEDSPWLRLMVEDILDAAEDVRPELD